MVYIKISQGPKHSLNYQHLIVDVRVAYIRKLDFLIKREHLVTANYNTVLCSYLSGPLDLKVLVQILECLFIAYYAAKPWGLVSKQQANPVFTIILSFSNISDTLLVQLTLC